MILRAEGQDTMLYGHWILARPCTETSCVKKKFPLASYVIINCVTLNELTIGQAITTIERRPASILPR